MSAANPVVETWDGLNRRIILKQGVTRFHWIDDIYIEYLIERKNNESFRVWESLVRGSGNVAKNQGKATPRLLTLLTDRRGITTKVVPFNESGVIRAEGEAITDVADTDPDLFDYSTITNPVIIEYQPPSAEVIVVDAIQKRLDYEGFLHYDPTSGNAGALHPFGTDALPVNNVADIVALSSEYSITKVKLRNGEFLATQDFIGWVFEGDGGRPVINPNGFDLSRSRFSEAVIQGDWINTSATVRFTDCTLEGINMSGQFRQCSLSPFISLKGGTCNFVDCYSGVVGDVKPVISFTGSPVSGRSSSYSGGWEFQDMTHADAMFSLDCETASVTVGATNTAGKIVIRGDYDLVQGLNGGTEIVEKLTTQEQMIDFIHRWTQADEVITPTRYERRDKDSKAVIMGKDVSTDGNGNVNLTE